LPIAQLWQACSGCANILSIGVEMKRFLIGIAFFMPISALYAADVPQAGTPYRAPLPYSPQYNWTGFYIGPMGGYGTSTSQGVNFKGGFAGGTMGLNAQIQNIVVGLEVDGAWSNIGQTASTFFGLVTATDRIQAMGSATGRLGVAIDSLLIYGKGGFAAASNNIKIVGPGGFVSDTEIHPGYTVGGGLEYGFTPNWSAKGEYMFTHYMSENYFAAIVPPGAPSGTINVQTVKFGVNYRFGWGNPVVARY
jgi:outer membrane immunogenic protein